jgi:hypothetical protein
MNEVRVEGSLPPELQTSTPRPVRLTAGGIAAAAMALACVAGGIFIAVWLSQQAGRDAARRERFEREAVTVEAEVTQVGPRQGKSGRHRVSYRYLAAGKLYDGRTSMSRNESRSLEPGSRIIVHYLPSDPGTSYAGSDPGGTPYWVVPLLTLVFIGMAGFIAASIRKQRYLLMEGRPALARVIRKRRVGQHKRRSRMQIEFNSLSGGRVEASYDENGAGPLEGSEVIIFYDRDKPSRVARFPMSLVKLDSR